MRCGRGWRDALGHPPPARLGPVWRLSLPCAWADVDFQRYKFNDAVASKGVNARWHIGIVAQRVKDAFEAHGLNAFEIGLLCYDEWSESNAVVDDDGNEIVKPRPADSRYGIRYEEAICMEAALMRRTTERLNARIADLESKVTP